MTNLQLRKYSFSALILLSFLVCRIVLAQEIQQRCGIEQKMALLRSQNPVYYFKQKLFQSEVTRQILLEKSSQSQRKSAETARELIEIPVVVHVITDSDLRTLGGVNNSNISDAQIRAQIRILNEDFSNATNTRGFNLNGIDTKLRFKLATTDPDQKPTSGIVRVRTTRTGFVPFNDGIALAQLSGWSSERYLNIWVCRFNGQSILGVGQYPVGTNIQGLETETGDAITDGVLVDFRYFGQSADIRSRLYKYGRTTTHEIGHWLGLLHTWGDEFCGDDYCADTPTCEDSNNTSDTTCRDVFSTCRAGIRTRNMTENYMDYTPDRCMNRFTADQTDRIWKVLDLSPRRSRLIKYLRNLNIPKTDGLTIDLSSNPVTAAEFDLKVQFKADFQDFEILIFNQAGRLCYNQNVKQSPSSITTIPTGSLPPGLYFLKVITSSESASKRLFILK